MTKTLRSIGDSTWLRKRRRRPAEKQRTVPASYCQTRNLPPHQRASHRRPLNQLSAYRSSTFSNRLMIISRQWPSHRSSNILSRRVSSSNSQVSSNSRVSSNNSQVSSSSRQDTSNRHYKFRNRQRAWGLPSLSSPSAPKADNQRIRSLTCSSLKCNSRNSRSHSNFRPNLPELALAATRRNLLVPKTHSPRYPRMASLTSHNHQHSNFPQLPNLYSRSKHQPTPSGSLCCLPMRLVLLSRSYSVTLRA